MKLKHNEVNFKVTYQCHQNWYKICLNIWTFLMITEDWRHAVKSQSTQSVTEGHQNYISSGILREIASPPIPGHDVAKKNQLIPHSIITFGPPKKYKKFTSGRPWSIFLIFTLDSHVLGSLMYTFGGEKLVVGQRKYYLPLYYIQRKWLSKSRIPTLTLGENWELGTNQSVVCRATTLFTKSAKMWNRGFNWPVYTGFWCPNSKTIS